MSFTKINREFDGIRIETSVREPKNWSSKCKLTSWYAILLEQILSSSNFPDENYLYQKIS